LKLFFQDCSLSSVISAIYRILPEYRKINKEKVFLGKKLGKRLQGNLKDKWRYWVGKYRILVKIETYRILKPSTITPLFFLVVFFFSEKRRE